MKRSHTLALLAAAMALTSSANAQTIVYDNSRIVPGSLPGTIMSTITVAATFTFTTPTGFDGIRFWDVELYSTKGYTGEGFSWFISADDAGLPGSMLASGTSTPVHTDLGAFPAFDGDWFQNDLFIGSLTLPPGTYWLGLHDNWGETLDPTTAPFIMWNAALPWPGRPFHRAEIQSYGSSIWEENFYDQAYQLTQSVTVTPEPASLALVATGLLGVFGVSRRRTRRLQ